MHELRRRHSVGDDWVDGVDSVCQLCIWEVLGCGVGRVLKLSRRHLRFRSILFFVHELQCWYLHFCYRFDF